MVNPWEADRVKLIDLYAVLSQLPDMLLEQWPVVGVVAKPIKECAYLDTLSRFLLEELEKSHRDGVVTKIEIFEMDTALGLTYGLEHIIKLLLSGGKKHYAVVMTEHNTLLFKTCHYGGVG